MHVSLIIEPGCDEPRVCSIILAEGLGIAHKSLIATIKRHLPRIERFGRVLLRKAPSKTASGTQLVTLVDLNENQALFVGSLSENTDKVIDFKATLIEEFDKARKALAQHAHTLVLQRQEALISLCNAMTDKFVTLEARFDRLHADYGRTYQATVTQAEREALSVKIKREKILTYVSTFIRCSRVASWSSFWDNFQEAYNVKVLQLPQKPNELFLDTVIRHGYIDSLWEFVNLR